jgi:hypothetical protein
MSKLTLQDSPVIVEAKIDTNYSPAVDYLLIFFGPLTLGLYSASERKAFIAALQAADAELDAAALRGKKEKVAA